MKTIDIDAALRRHRMWKQGIVDDGSTKTERMLAAPASDTTVQLRDDRKNAGRCPFDASLLMHIGGAPRDDRGVEVGCPQPDCDFTMMVHPGTLAWNALHR